MLIEVFRETRKTDAGRRPWEVEKRCGECMHITGYAAEGLVQRYVQLSDVPRRPRRELCRVGCLREEVSGGVEGRTCYSGVLPSVDELEERCPCSTSWPAAGPVNRIPLPFTVNRFAGLSMAAYRSMTMELPAISAYLKLLDTLGLSGTIYSGVKSSYSGYS